MKGTTLCVYEGNVYGLSNDTGEMFRNRRKNAWKVKMPAGGRGRAILVADGTLYVAAMPVDTDPTKGEVRTYKTDSGGTIGGAVALPFAPKFDGMAAVPGRLFVCTDDGQVVCLEGR